MDFLPEIHIGPYKVPKVPLELELWTGKSVEVPPGSIVFNVHTWPELWKIRFSLSLVLGWIFKRTVGLNFIFQKRTTSAEAGDKYLSSIAGADIWTA